MKKFACLTGEALCLIGLLYLLKQLADKMAGRMDFLQPCPEIVSVNLSAGATEG